MADRQKQALVVLDRVVALLERVDGLDTAWHESTGGWTIDSRARWLQRFEELRGRVVAGGDVEHEASHLVRDLDHDGVHGGEVWSAAGDLQWRLDRYQRQRSKSAADGR